MNSVIESLKLPERERIRVTHMGKSLYYKLPGMTTWINTYQDGEYTVHQAPLPGFTVPHPRDWNFPFDNYFIGIHAPIRSGGIRNLEKFIVYPSS